LPPGVQSLPQPALKSVETGGNRGIRLTRQWPNPSLETAFPVALPGSANATIRSPAALMPLPRVEAWHGSIASPKR
jgi:hypothetical protein